MELYVSFIGRIKTNWKGDFLAISTSQKQWDSQTSIRLNQLHFNIKNQCLFIMYNDDVHKGNFMEAGHVLWPCATLNSSLNQVIFLNHTKFSVITIGVCLLSVCCDKDHGRKQLGGERVYSAYTSRSQYITEGSQGRNSNHGKMMLAAFLANSCLNSFLMQSKTTFPRITPTTMGPQKSVNNQNNSSQTWPQAKIIETILELKSPLLRWL